MSKNVTILEGDQSRAFGHVQKLKTAKSGGGSVLWVDEDETKTKSLYATTNGTYIAADGSYVKTEKYTEGGKKKTRKVIKKDPNKACYGYDEVDVNIITSVKGYKEKGGAGSGDFAPFDISVDEDGFLIEDEIPVRIEIVTPPSKTTYITGEPINTAGMVVKAYYTDGSEYGTLSRDEYTIDPLVAGQSEEEHDSATSDLIDGSLAFSYTDHVFGSSDPPSGNGVRGGTVAFANKWLSGAGNWQVLFGVASASPFTYEQYQIWSDGTEHITGSGQASSYTYNGKTVYVKSYSTSLGDKTYNVPMNELGSAVSGNAMAWTAIYGHVDITGGNIVTVKWSPSDDVGELTDTFRITINNPTPIPIDSGDSGGGSGGGSW